MGFTKQREYFVGIDSDGTVFDSMSIKHTHAFIPAAVEVFGLEGCAEIFKEIEERINLYSLSRGINRFPGLLMTFEKLTEGGYYDAVAIIEELKKFMDSGYALSNAGFENWLKDNLSETGEKILAWCKLADKYFEELTNNIPPYEEVHSAIDYMRNKADIMVVSAATAKGLKKDWANAGLADKVNFIAGQEFGNKGEQLLYAVSRGCEPEKMLMVGDAPGDYDAAKKVGAKFYPIIPGKEDVCWSKLEHIYFDMFVNEQYNQTIETKLYEEFIAFLKGEN